MLVGHKRGVASAPPHRSSELRTFMLLLYRTRALLGACACISTGRKCVLNSESVPNNELCIIN